MLTIFSMADARYFPVTLQAKGDKQGSLGEPRPDIPSSEEPSLRNTQQIQIKAVMYHIYMYVFNNSESSITQHLFTHQLYFISWVMKDTGCGSYEA